MLKLASSTTGILAFSFLLSFPFLTSSALTVPPLLAGRDLASPGSTEARIDPRSGDQKATAVVFLSARCPCSASHEPALKALAQEFKDIRFVGVHANTDEGIDESAAHFSKAALSFPVIQDPGAKLASQFGALKTPHVFVVSKTGQVVYQGGVDDSHTAAQATKPYLKSALAAISAGKAPETAQTRTLGCIIRR